MAELNASEGPEPEVSAELLAMSEFDPQALSHVVSGAEFEHRRLSGGGSRIDLLQCCLPHSVLNRGVYAPAVLVTGTFAKEAITIGTMLQQQDSTILNGSTVQMGTVQIYTEGSEMCYRAWPNATWLAFVISREQLHDYCAQHLDYVPSVPTSGVVSINPQDRRSGDRLLAALRDLDGSLRSLSRLPNAARVGESIEHDLLARIAGFLGRRPHVQASGDRRRVRLCGQILRDTIALVERNPTEMLDLHSMSKATGLSPRTLQRTFQAEYGLSPQGWLRVERLNRVRADLLDPGQERSVTQTATRWGFFHLGRFSQYYRQLFGERPSATSARRAATHSTRTFEFSLSRSSNGGRADLS